MGHCLFQCELGENGENCVSRSPLADFDASVVTRNARVKEITIIMDDDRPLGLMIAPPNKYSLRDYYCVHA